MHISFKLHSHHNLTMKGKLKFNNRFKGYGLITENESGVEYIVSPSGIQDTVIKDGDNVVFEATEGRGGMIATNIQLDTFRIKS